MQKVALKWLKNSDLTFFRSQFLKLNVGGQKAINLNADVFVKKLFPALADPTRAGGGSFLVNLTVYGPGPTVPSISLARNIRKGDTYKNWRLNGEFIFDPEDHPGRFDALKEDDVAVLEFDGAPFPTAVRVTLVSAALDATLHAQCANLLGSKRMIALDPGQIDALIKVGSTASPLPVTGSEEAAALEDVALGGSAGIGKLRRRTEARPLTYAELSDAKKRAEEVGRIGELLVDSHLARSRASGLILGYTWESAINAIAPFDFRFTPTSDSEDELIDVKTTEQRFSNPIHVSFAELRCMAMDPPVYRIYRVYEATGTSPKCRVSEPLRKLALDVLQIVAQLPSFVRPDGFSIDPERLTWGDEFIIEADSEG